MTLLVIGPALATTVLRFSVEELAERAEVIAHGTCTEVTGRDTPHGVMTDVTLQVTSALKGQPPLTFKFTIYGGRTDTRGTFVAGSPTFEVGEELIVFLDRVGPRGFRVPIGMAQGKFTIVEEDGRKVAKRNLEGLRLLDPQTNEVEEAQPEQGVPLDELLKQIQEHLTRKGR